MERVNRYQSTRRNDKTVAVLQAFHTHLPPDGKANFVRHGQTLDTDQAIHDHAESLVNGLLAPLRSLSSTPCISPRLGMEDSIENFASQSTGPLVRKSRLKTDCLKRDGGKCIVTKVFDVESIDKSDRSLTATYTECAQIIPFSLASWKDEREEHAKKIVWTTLVRFSQPSRIEFTLPEKISMTRIMQ
ncbi:hypothetical protein PDIG_72940 [Penicillium digitatum PHI26]|uniref:Uncharacterized protein n=2 Tax=Penicillium digitatum TaxID=36651 RepID=K9FXM9_PEND2|nr:hypothetical protein PDIP_43420 [Penicillium digitatum Pd1]EKV07433.1 hypothetical protein PDIG_72940 [Penicillium digitatum PHI26]EKV14469.1 hypothetical protein PDIP_43420 [Penicillium digitatum Pd1]